MKNRVLIVCFIWISSCVSAQSSSQTAAAGIRSNDCVQSHLELVSSHDCNDFEHGDWILIFEDDFNGNTIDKNKWFTCEDGWNRFHGECGKELQSYLDENIIVDNGILKLVAMQDPLGIYRPDCNETLPYSSGWIQTKTKFKYGLIEARCRVPYGMGFWPAFWLFGHSTEIDIFEIYGNENNIIHTNMHHWYGDISRSCSKTQRNDDLYNAFHVFRIEWNEFKIVYSVDGNIIRTQRKYQTELAQEVDNCIQYTNGNHYYALNIFPDSAQSIILNLAISNTNSHPGPDNTTVFPSSLDVDYVRVYKRNNKSHDNSVTTFDSDRTNYITSRNITIANSFGISIDSGEYLNCFATKDIIINPDFCAEYGSEFLATIQSPPRNVELADAQYSENYTEQDNTQNDDVLLRLYPNPSNGYVSIELNDVSSKISAVVVEDCRGNVIFSKTGIELPEFSFRIGKSGLYFARIRTDNMTFLKKLIVK